MQACALPLTDSLVPAGCMHACMHAWLAWAACMHPYVAAVRVAVRFVLRCGKPCKPYKSWPANVPRAFPGGSPCLLACGLPREWCVGLHKQAPCHAMSCLVQAMLQTTHVWTLLPGILLGTRAAGWQAGWSACGQSMRGPSYGIMVRSKLGLMGGTSGYAFEPRASENEPDRHLCDFPGRHPRHRAGLVHASRHARMWVLGWVHGCRYACRRWPGYTVALAAHTRRMALAAGDALYLPPGWWHQVDSAGELPDAM